MWRDNPLLTRMLGLCPLLAVCDRLVIGIAVGTMLAIVMLWTQSIASLGRHWVPVGVRLPVQALLAALAVIVIGLLLQTFRVALHARLGIYLPVMAGCCLVLVRTEEFGGRQPLGSAISDAVSHGLAVLALASLISAIRELLGHGTLLGEVSLLWPESQWSGVPLLPAGATLPVVLMPAGALFVLAGLLALHNAATARRDR
jgi:electron transport complex protein RnfE